MSVSVLAPALAVSLYIAVVLRCVTRDNWTRDSHDGMLATSDLILSQELGQNCDRGSDLKCVPSLDL